MRPPHDELFDSGNIADSRVLRRGAVRGSVFSVGSQILRACLFIVSVSVMAHLLAPNDFGLVAMVTVVSGAFGIFQVLGLKEATVQKADLTYGQINSLFWINLAASTGLGLLLASLAPVLAWFYGREELIPITLVLALGLPFNGLSTQHWGLTQRRLRFGSIAVIDIASTVVSVAVGISLAVLAFEYWAIVAMHLSKEGVRALSYWIREPWRPSRPGPFKGVGEMLRFGGNLTISRFFLFIASRIDNVLIGRFLGADSLGLYTKSYGLMQQPLLRIAGPLNDVAGPVLSRLQEDIARFRSHYRMILVCGAGLGFPLVAFSLIATEELTDVFLGPQWTEVVDIYRLLSAGAFFGILNIATKSVYMSLGRMERRARILAVKTGVLVLGFFIAIRWGSLAMAATYSLVQALFFLPELAYCLKGTGVKLRDVWDGVRFPLFATAVAALVTWLVRARFLGASSSLWALLSLAAVFALALAILWTAFPEGRRRLGQLRRLARSFRQGSSDGTSA